MIAINTLLPLFFLLISLFASLFWLLAAVPFAYQQVVTDSLIPGLQLAANGYLPFYFISGLFLTRKLKNCGLMNSLIIYHVIFSAAAAVALYFLNDLPLGLRLTLMLLHSGFLGALGGAFMIDHLAGLDDNLDSAENNFEFRIFMTLFLTSLALIGVFGFIQAFSVSGSLSIFILMALIFPVLIAVKSFARIMPLHQRRVERGFVTLIFATCIYWFVRHQIVASLGAAGFSFEIYSVFLAVGSVSLIAAHPLPRQHPLFTAAIILGQISLLALALFYLQYLDWNFLGQKTLLIAGILVVFFQANRFFKDLPKNKSRAPKRIGTLSFVLFLTAPAISAGILRFIPDSSVANVAENFAKDLLRSEKVIDDEFYFLLQRNANLPLSTPLTLSDLQTSQKSVLAANQMPNIFIFVVDSLRRDYLGVYNPAVHFTPSIDQFAADSLIFKNAFTRFGATGLSEPAIWAGAMIPHQSYPTSFLPLNSLEKLVSSNPYQNFISQDSVLKLILSPQFSFTELDPNTSTQELDLCRTLSHLETKMDALVSGDRPVFVYTQSQNLHVSVIAKRPAKAASQFSGFYPGYVESLIEIDQCFGNFISYLKKTGKFKDSVIVLTSDHGDSLGEDGRFGHAYTLFPEILRIPLLFHLPQNQYQTEVDTTGVVFQTDITPTLYQILGLTPEQDHLDIRGKSLLLPARPSTGNYLLVSSYGPVFALLSNAGRNLRIFDAINLKDYAYDLTQNETKPLAEWNNSEKTKSMKTLKQKIEEWHGFYGYKNEVQ